MKTIVITGSTRGIGLGLAAEFLKRDCCVAINGRAQNAVDRAVADLAGRCPPDRVWGQPGDMTQYDDVQRLWDNARSHFGSIDIWINNAGIAHPDLQFWALPKETIDQTVSLNLIGLMYGCRVAINGMRAQGHGFIYNMYGFGSTGMLRNGMSIYGSSKRAVNYFTEALTKELDGQPVKIGSLSPGMVITDLISEQYKDRSADFERAKKIFNLLADRVENVTPHLVDQILANDKNGAALKHMSTPRMMSRMITGRIRKRDLFAEP
ncbi:MAG TPA: SDR family oxidoreductase [Anaerolineae bacterium]|nr:SDR family oxidoreductase [Anaerolineae bacterium]